MRFFFLNLESKDTTNNTDYTDGSHKFLMSNCTHRACRSEKCI